MKLHSLLPLCLLSLLSGAGLCAESAKNNERWFEIEVILFSQLGDKSALQEQFPPSQPLPQPKRVLELLAPFLTPDISTLKQQLPECGTAQDKRNLLQQAQQAYVSTANMALFSIKSEQQIAQQVGMPAPDDMSEDASAPKTTPQPTIDTPAADVTYDTTNAENNALLEPEADTPVPLSDEQRALLQQADEYFQQQQFPYISAPLTAPLCRLPAEQMAQLAANEPDFDADGFTLPRVPQTIDAAEQLDSDKPYLLSADSLQLTDIVKKLRHSKNFHPLLHVGWRQAPKSRLAAVPVHLFAGDNLDAYYQQQLTQYRHELATAEQQEAALQQALSLDDAENGQAAQQQAMAQQRKQQQLHDNIQRIVATMNHFNLSPEQVIADYQVDTEGEALVPADKQQFTLPAPKPPLQPWLLDGFFKVHLNHYLFISADFNIVNQTAAEQASQALAAQALPVAIDSNKEKNTLKTIRFSQNRRVISGEIHYFDHPYLGMIVQIRRYQRPEQPAEPESNEDGGEESTPSL